MAYTNPEDNKQYCRTYYATHKEELLAKMRLYRQTHKQPERAAYYKAYYESHKEEIRKYNKAWRQANKEKLRRQAQEYYQTHKKQHAINNQENRERRKLEILGYYSGGTPKCAHCGLDDTDALCIDHVDNNGAEHRRSIGQIRHAGDSVYRWLKRNGFPEGFQVLCGSCNLKKEVQRRRAKRIK